MNLDLGKMVSMEEWLEFQRWVRDGKPSAQVAHGGNVTFTIRKPPAKGEKPGTGRIIHVQQSSNLVVDTGLEHSADLWGKAVAGATNIAVGTGSTAAAAGDVALGTEVFTQVIDRRIRATKTITLEMLIATGDANGNTLAEEGIFSGPVLMARALISPTIAKTAGIEVTVSHLITMASS